MTKEQQVKLVKIGFLSLLILSILLSITGLMVIRSSNKSLGAQITSQEQAWTEAIATCESGVKAEISRSRKELLEMIQANDADILSLQNEVGEVRDDIGALAMQLIREKVGETEERVEATEEEEEVPALVPEKVDKEVIEPAVVEPAPRRPLWKRIVQFWKWF